MDVITKVRLYTCLLQDVHVLLLSFCYLRIQPCVFQQHEKNSLFLSCSIYPHSKSYLCCHIGYSVNRLNSNTKFTVLKLPKLLFKESNGFFMTSTSILCKKKKNYVNHYFLRNWWVLSFVFLCFSSDDLFLIFLWHVT